MSDTATAKKAIVEWFKTDAIQNYYMDNVHKLSIEAGLSKDAADYILKEDGKASSWSRDAKGNGYRIFSNSSLTVVVNEDNVIVDFTNEGDYDLLNPWISKYGFEYDCGSLLVKK